MNFLRLRRTPKLALPQHETDIFFVDSDGTFKKMDPDGNVSSVAGAGSLPSPTDEGDVLTVSSGEWAGEPPSGGSMTILDPGDVTVAELLASGAKTLYTPAAEAFVGVTWGRGGVPIDNGWTILAFDQGAIDDTSITAGNLPAWDGNGNNTTQTFGWTTADGTDNTPQTNFPTDPVKARLFAGGGPGALDSAVESYPGTGENVAATTLTPAAVGSTKLLAGSVILASNGWIYYCSDGGVTDLVEPTWTDHEDDTPFADGTAEWTGILAAPTVGIAKPRLMVMAVVAV